VRTDTISIAGKDYPVKGMSVSQSLTTDLDAFDARQSKNRKALSDIRLRRMAMSLQAGGAFLTDPHNPKGEIGCASMSTEDVVKWLDSDVFSDMQEFYAAETIVLALADAPKAKKPGEGDGTGVGELLATESSTGTKETSVA
jgi:hypothetical protein